MDFRFTLTLTLTKQRFVPEFFSIQLFENQTHPPPTTHPHPPHTHTHSSSLSLYIYLSIYLSLCHKHTPQLHSPLPYPFGLCMFISRHPTEYLHGHIYPSISIELSIYSTYSTNLSIYISLCVFCLAPE